MDSAKIAAKLWDAANLVTAFAVAQNLAMVYSIAKGDWTLLLKGSAAHGLALAATIVFTVFYIVAIVWCGRRGSSLDAPANASVWKIVTIARVLTVVLFTLAMLGALYGHREHELQQEKPKAAIGGPDDRPGRPASRSRGPFAASQAIM